MCYIEDVNMFVCNSFLTTLFLINQTRVFQTRWRPFSVFKIVAKGNSNLNDDGIKYSAALRVFLIFKNFIFSNLTMLNSSIIYMKRLINDNSTSNYE